MVKKKQFASSSMHRMPNKFAIRKWVIHGDECLEFRLITLNYKHPDRYTIPHGKAIIIDDVYFLANEQKK